MAGVPFIFGNATTSIPLTNLDADFNTGLTIGNTTVGLGNTVTTLGNVTLNNVNFGGVANAVIYTNSGGNVTSNASVFSVNAGSVGIGTASPAYPLDVNGNARVNAALLVAGDISQSGTNVITNSNASMILKTNTANPIIFQPNAAEAMRITSAGNVGIGTSSPGSYGNLAVIASGSIPGIYIGNSGSGFPIEAQVTTSSYIGPGIRSRVTSNTPANSFQAYSYYNDNFGNYMFYVQGTGNVQNTNNSYGAISDVKLKENIVDATPKLSDLMKVQVRQYNLKSDQTLKQIGVIAQELETIFPGMIEETADRDVDNNDLGTTSKAVKYSVFVPILIKAMQEQQVLITTLQEQITVLQAKVGV